MARHKTKVIFATVSILVALTIAALLLLRNYSNHLDHRSSSSDQPGQKFLENETPQEVPSVDKSPIQQKQTSFNKNLYSISEPSSLWVVVNKKHPLPAKYVPSDLTEIGNTSLRKEPVTATLQLLNAAEKDNVSLKVISGYRSYDSQGAIYNRYVREDGQEKADTYSARPGHSEHQTGLAVDLGNANGSCDLELCFENTAGGIWLASNAHKYGFTIRYIKNKSHITGYQFEPWHLRYVGKELATELHKGSSTMEEFFNLPSSSTY